MGVSTVHYVERGGAVTLKSWEEFWLFFAWLLVLAACVSVGFVVVVWKML